MKNLIKLKVILLVFTMIFAPSASAGNKILPVPKPLVDEEIKLKTAKKKHIYPQKKPENKSAISNEQTDEPSQEITAEINIYPKKKPIIVKKKIEKITVKSEVLSKKDFKIARSVFEAIDKKKWQTALKLSKKAKDKSLYKLVNYL